MTDQGFKADLDEVKSLGGDGKKTPSARTDDQTQIALFWLESSPLKWSRIARTVATDKGLDSGRTRGCSPCSTWRWRMATSPWRLEEPLQLLAAGYRDPEWRRSVLDAVATDTA